MAFNGSGVFQRLYNWVNDAAANIKIRADRMDAEMDGFATGLSTCITKDGQTTVTANLPMAGFRHTGVGNAAARNNYASFGQVQDGVSAWADAGGTSDAITASYSIPITTLVDGQLCFVRASAANTTTTPTFSPNGLTARTIVRAGGQALQVGDIRASGQELILRYNVANTRWELLNPFVNVSNFATLTGVETLSGKQIGIRSSGTGAFDMRIVNSENLTAQRDLTITLGNANRILSLTGNVTRGAIAQYTPTLTNVTNVASSSNILSRWYEDSGYVFTQHIIDVAATTGATLFELGISLPLASNFGATSNAIGVATSETGQMGAIRADATNDRLALRGTPANTSTHRYVINASYQVI